MSTLELIALDRGTARIGCTRCRSVWRTDGERSVVCRECGAEESWAALWAKWADADGTTDYRQYAPWSSQAHRTAMLIVLIATVSVWALALCARLVASP